MYAVIETGGKQYRVEVGTELEVESLDVELGKTVTIDRVLLVADGDDASIGRPLVDGAAVSAEVVRQTRGDKLTVFKYGPKTRRRVKKGHRQELTILRVSDIVLNGKSAAKSAAKADSDARTERQRLEDAAAAQAAKDAELAAKLAAGARKPAAKPSRTKAARDGTVEADVAKPETKKQDAAKPDAKATAKPDAKATAKPDAKATAKPSTAKATSTKTSTRGETEADAAKTETKPRATKPRTTKKDQ